MSRTICLRCRASLRRALRPKSRSLIPSIRAYSSEQIDPFRSFRDENESSREKLQEGQDGAPNPSFEIPKSPKIHFRDSIGSSRVQLDEEHKDTLDITALLSKPTWSVRSLLPPESEAPKQKISPQQLHHLLRLSALPPPSSPEEEAQMLKTLHSQLHFVRDIQSVDTEGVEPLQSIRDETEEGIREATIGVEDLRDAFREEEIKGRNRRPRRKRTPVVEEKEVEGWDVLGTAEETVKVGGSRYFVVRSGKEGPKKEAVEEKKNVNALRDEDALQDFIQRRKY